MNRALLCGTVEGLASGYGYNFTLNDKSYYPATISRYPAAFMSQPEFSSIEGRKNGRITYKVTLTLAHQAAKLPPTERNDLLDQMEVDLTQIFIGLSQAQFVAVVKNLTIRPLDGIDTHGALAMEAVAYVETIF